MFRPSQVRTIKHLPYEFSMLIYAGFDPFVYTQGHWLDRDQTQREARVLKFDFDALVDTAIKCSPGASRVVQCEKKEGGFNRVFMVRLDNDTTVVARLPTRLAGPPGLTVSSEVATLRYSMSKSPGK